MVQAVPGPRKDSGSNRHVPAVAELKGLQTDTQLLRPRSTLCPGSGGVAGGYQTLCPPSPPLTACTRQAQPPGRDLATGCVCRDMCPGGEQVLRVAPGATAQLSAGSGSFPSAPQTAVSLSGGCQAALEVRRAPPTGHRLPLGTQSAGGPRPECALLGDGSQSTSDRLALNYISFPTKLFQTAPQDTTRPPVASFTRSKKQIRTSENGGLAYGGWSQH